MYHLYGDLNILKHLKLSKEKLPVQSTLKYFDPKKSLTLHADASLKGLGAVLLQESHPEYSVSKSLEPHQKEYVAIVLDNLAVTWVMETVHFLYSKNFNSKQTKAT